MTIWTDFVKAFAKKANISYGCALSMPETSQEYRFKYKKGEFSEKPIKMKVSNPPRIEDIYSAVPEEVAGASPLRRLPQTPVLSRASSASSVSAPSKAPAKAPAKEPAPTKKVRTKKIKDLIYKQFDGVRYYANQYTDFPQIYRIINGKFYEVGTEGDYGEPDFYDDPKPVPDNFKFFRPNGKELIPKRSTPPPPALSRASSISSLSTGYDRDTLKVDGREVAVGDILFFDTFSGKKLGKIIKIDKTFDKDDFYTYNITFRMDEKEEKTSRLSQSGLMKTGMYKRTFKGKTAKRKYKEGPYMIPLQSVPENFDGKYIEYTDLGA